MQLSLTFDAVAQELTIESPELKEPMGMSRMNELILTLYVGDCLALNCKFADGAFDLRVESG